jgi:hypothetical protein
MDNGRTRVYNETRACKACVVSVLGGAPFVIRISNSENFEVSLRSIVLNPAAYQRKHSLLRRGWSRRPLVNMRETAVASRENSSVSSRLVDWCSFSNPDKAAITAVSSTRRPGQV